MWPHTFPDYQLIPRQISNQLARGHKTIGNHLNNINNPNATDIIRCVHNTRGHELDLVCKVPSVNAIDYTERDGNLYI